MSLPWCTYCGRRKKPIGRDVGAAAANGYCDHECEGYHCEPRPGYDWPSELDLTANAREIETDDIVSIEGRGSFRVVGFELGGDAVQLIDPADGKRFTVYAWRVRKVVQR